MRLLMFELLLRPALLLSSSGKRTANRGQFYHQHLKFSIQHLAKSLQTYNSDESNLLCELSGAIWVSRSRQIEIVPVWPTNDIFGRVQLRDCFVEHLAFKTFRLESFDEHLSTYNLLDLAVKTFSLFQIVQKHSLVPEQRALQTAATRGCSSDKNDSFFPTNYRMN